MHREFERFGIPRYRILTGVLQLTGSIALLLGFLMSELILIASAGLSLLMLLGLGVRIWIKDSWTFAIPAFILMCLNALIFYMAY